MRNKSSRKKKQDVFENEKIILKQAQATNKKNLELTPLSEEYNRLTQEYAQLLGDARLVTSVSDRLQNKINRANDQLNEANEKITAQNEKLRYTIVQLREAKVGRKATTIVLLLAVVLFLISEAFIEPQIEKVIDDWYIGLVFKGMIALLLKPIENVVQRILLRKQEDQNTILMPKSKEK